MNYGETIIFEQLEQEEYIESFVRLGGRSLCLNKRHPTLTAQDMLALADDFFEKTYQMQRRGKYVKWCVTYFWYGTKEIEMPCGMEEYEKH